MAVVAEAKLRQDIQSILEGADLTQLSAKKVRRQLEEKYSSDLTARKQEIDSMLMELIAEQNEQSAADEPSTEKNSPKVVPAENGRNTEDHSVSNDEDSDPNESDVDKASDESDFEPPTDLADVNSSKKSKKGGARKDEQLARKLQQEENSQGRRTRSGNATTKPARGKRKTKSKEDDGETKPKKQKKTGYMKECQLSPQLAEIMETDSMVRSDVVKRMWEIIRERNLMDPRNKQFMLCDAQLLKVFRRKRVRTFGMMKYLKDHIITDNE